MIDRDTLIARREELAGEAKKARTLADRLEGAVITLDELIGRTGQPLQAVPASSDDKEAG